MWVLENETSFQAERALLWDERGAEIWVVVVRGTYDILTNGRLELAAEQVPVAMAPAYLGEPNSSSLKHDTDLVVAKPTTDIVVVGQAYAPRGEPVSEVDVGLALDSIDLHKTLRVIGDRRWVRRGEELVLTDPELFETMPITYERAFGGVEAGSTEGEEDQKRSLEPSNPIGRGFASDPSRLEGCLAPNVVDPRDESIPAGFGPIPRDWEPRSTLAGTYDENWRKNRMPILPEDFDPRFFQCAPEDQQPEAHLEGGEQVALKNLTPGGKLSFELPRVHLTFVSDFGTEVVEREPRLHTVIIEPDEARLQLVWHDRLDCARRLYKLRRTLVTERRSSP